MELELRLILVSVACFLLVIISIIVFRYRQIQKKRDTVLGKEQVLGRLFLRKISKLGEESEGEDFKRTLKKLNGLMKAFFSELFDISYEFDYVELNEELGKKGVDEAVRKEVIDYSMKVEKLEYGGEPVTESDLMPLVEKSVFIIRSITEERKPEEEEEIPAAAPVSGPPQKKKPSVLAARIEGILRKPFQRPQKPVEEPAPKPPGKPSPATEELLDEIEEKMPKTQAPPKVAEEEPSGEEPAPSTKIPKLPPPGKDKAITKIRKLLVLSEDSMSGGNHDEAMDHYMELRQLYDALPPETKRTMYPEAKRIIALYNNLLREYKKVLTGSD